MKSAIQRNMIMQTFINSAQQSNHHQEEHDHATHCQYCTAAKARARGTSSNLCE